MIARLPKPLQHGLVLGLFSLVAALLLSASHSMTEAAIAQRKAEDLLMSLAQVLPAEQHDNDVSKSLREVPDVFEGPVTVHLATRDGSVTGAAFELSGPGYSGSIRVLIGIDAGGMLLGVRVLSHTETPGLGDKIEVRKAPWIKGFTGLSLDNPGPGSWAVRKDGGVFDQFSGATITPRAVVATVKRGLEFFDRNRSAILAPMTEDAA